MEGVKTCFMIIIVVVVDLFLRSYYFVNLQPKNSILTQLERRGWLTNNLNSIHFLIIIGNNVGIRKHRHRPAHWHGVPRVLPNIPEIGGLDSMHNYPIQHCTQCCGHDRCPYNCHQNRKPPLIFFQPQQTTAPRMPQILGHKPTTLTYLSLASVASLPCFLSPPQKFEPPRPQEK